MKRRLLSCRLRTIQETCDATPGTVKVHRIKEVLRNLSGILGFPVAERRKERMLKDQDFNAPEETPELAEGDDEGMPDPVDTSDDEGDDAEVDEPSAGAEARPNAEAEKPSAGAEAPLSWNRHQGLRVGDRRRKGERQEL